MSVSMRNIALMERFKTLYLSRGLLWKYKKIISCQPLNIMSLGGPMREKADHLSVTAKNSRQELKVTAKVAEIKDISRTVKLVKLYVEDPHFFFKAGQWVDMFIPGIDTVGGFSMCSAPDLLFSTGDLHLAIKYAKHPPAFWVHTKCKIGDEVELRAGGDFYYDPRLPECQKDLLLIAGGVGINPLYSILLHFYYLHLKSLSKGAQSKQATILFSAKNEEELLFIKEMQTLTQLCGNIHLKLHCTREKPSSNEKIICGRISEEDIQAVVANLDTSKTEVFICGPSGFISTMEAYCLNVGILKNDIHFEKWW